LRKIGDMVGAAVGRQEVARLVRANLILHDWADIVGPGLAARSHPDKFERGTVWVAVEGSAWAQELRMLKETILKRLADRCGEEGLFLDLRFGVRPFKVVPLPSTEEPTLTRAVVELPEGPDLSIREIAERRLQNWTDAGGT
jgi:predicted nucleic acid-binding Zn ribbon protein